MTWEIDRDAGNSCAHEPQVSPRIKLLRNCPSMKPEEERRGSIPTILGLHDDNGNGSINHTHPPARSLQMRWKITVRLRHSLLRDLRPVGHVKKDVLFGAVSVHLGTSESIDREVEVWKILRRAQHNERPLGERGFEI